MPLRNVGAPRFSQQLERILTPSWKQYRQTVTGWLASGAFSLTYPALLVETYHYVKHSVSLMEYACELMSDTRMHSEAKSYLKRHAREEAGHEEWLLDDLEALGFARRDVLNAVPLSETVSLIGTQLYVIRYLHPLGLFGYIYTMESRPPTKTALRQLRGLGIPSRAMTFLERHGRFDVGHKHELAMVLDEYLTTTVVRSAAIVSATTGLSNINSLLRRICVGDFLCTVSQHLDGLAVNGSNL